MEGLATEEKWPATSLTILSLAIALALHIGPARGDDYFPPDAIENLGGQPKDIDLSSFSKTGGQAPGMYKTEVYVDGQYVEEREFQFVTRTGKLMPVLTKADYIRWGVEENATSSFMQLSMNQPIEEIAQAIPSSSVNFNFPQQRLDISIPQESIRKKARGYVPPEEWNDGLNTLFVNYGYSGANNWSDDRSGSDSDSYLNLRSGINLDAWRLRNYSTYSHTDKSDHWKSINTYVQRDIRKLKSKLVMGESYTPADVFDSFSFRGLQLSSDDNMLPESLRGFAPVVRGIAQSNAQVTIRQDGNTIWQSYVPPGPFAINDLYPTSTSGDLDVSVREADGTMRHFVQPYSAVPIMQREGRLKYNITSGKYRTTGESERKPDFVLATGIYGLPFTTTVYGGTLIANHYQTGAIGAGKGLGDFGSMSVDSTFAKTSVHNEDNQGASFRFQYSKDIQASGTSFSLAGYRYSTSGYYDFSEANGYRDTVQPFESRINKSGQSTRQQVNYDWRYRHNKRSKEQVNISQSLGQYGGIFLSAYQQQYWGISNSERSMNFGYNNNINDINYTLNYSYAKTPYASEHDQVVSLAIQIPLERFLPSSWLNLSGNTSNHGDTSSAIGLSGTALADNNLTYNVQQGYTNRGTGANGNASVDYKASFGEYSAGYNYSRHSHQVNYGAAGAIIAHPYGLSFGQQAGDTMALIKAKGADHVKVQNNTGVYTDSRGYAIVPYVTPYRRNPMTLDTSSLGDNVDILTDTETVTPTQGALVMAEYPTLIGQKIMLTLQQNTIPFGASASIKNGSVTTTGIVDQHQRVYLSGAPHQGIVQISWQNGHCQAPYQIPVTATVTNVTAVCR